MNSVRTRTLIGSLGLGQDKPIGRFLIWDFDGTLGYRAGHRASALQTVLEEAMPGRDFERERPGTKLRGGFPWHTPEVPHPELSLPDSWWDALLPTFVRAFEVGGLDACTSKKPAGKIREAYVDPRHWPLCDEKAPALRELSSHGWTHLVLSIHVPELPEILHNLGLDGHLTPVLNSAEGGYEKPHPRAFDGVLEALAYADTSWMVGDNLEADVRGAGGVGLPAILVRRPEARRAVSLRGPPRSTRHRREGAVARARADLMDRPVLPAGICPVPLAWAERRSILRA